MDKKIRFEVRKNRNTLHEMQEALDELDDVEVQGEEILEETFGHYSEEITGFYAEKIFQDLEGLSKGELEILKQKLKVMGKSEEDILYEDFEKLRDYEAKPFAEKQVYEKINGVFEFIFLILFSPLVFLFLLVGVAQEIVKEYSLMVERAKKRKQLFKMNPEKYWWLE